MHRFALKCATALMFGVGAMLASGQVGLAGSSSAIGLQSIIPKASVQGLVASVSSDTITKYIAQLSGHEPVMIGGRLDTLLTRYAYNWRFDHAAQYVYERFQDYGLDVEYDTHVISGFDFYSVQFLDAEHGWAVGSKGKLFSTRDGGSTWVRHSTGAGIATLYGVSFIDTLVGWTVGEGGWIFKSIDGGSTWVPQGPGNVSAREVIGLDSLNAWVVGASGTVLRTDNGGTSWTSVAGGGIEDLYGCDFRSGSRGWIVGAKGVIRFWDGLTLAAQTSGRAEDLLDVDFISDDVGWAVGAGGTILKTIDGGADWVAQSVPADVDEDFEGVCFVDNLDGWVVGTSGTMLHTSDGGATWEVKPTGTLFDLRRVSFVDGERGWAVGLNSVVLRRTDAGIILHTTDGGATWANQCGNLPTANIRVVKNIVATKPGTVSTDQVIICGHVDDRSQDPENLAPGADDNASGTAAAIEAARVMAGSSFEKTIKFIGWGAEEVGGYGAQEYAAQARDRGDVLIGVLNLDMIGYASHAPEDADLFGDQPSTWLVDFALACGNAYVPSLATLEHTDPTMNASDHYVFWRAGYNAIDITEDYPLCYPDYHTVNDTLGNITMSFCSDVVRMGVATLAELAVPDMVAGAPSTAQAVFAVVGSPNPSRGSIRVTFALGSESPVKVGIYDVAGRRVRSLYRGALSAGRQALAWAGDDDVGTRVSPGIYFAEVETPGARASAR
ncbi:MAG TPA: M20/M25/M40 family metallo-hydrolase, partial [bacterium]|nr:M20/M25/M40 family metallo-hydrolase [bacterium]